MFRSIRWRLVTSYVLLTVLTVSIVGVLTLSLVKQFVKQRVVEDLTANAESVANQAAPLVWPLKRQSALQELAQTSAFLGGVRVRILDDDHRVLADSGSPTGVDQIMWLTPPEFELEPLFQSWILVIPQDRRSGMQFSQNLPFLDQLPTDVRATIVRRIAGVWGSRLSFEGFFKEARFPPLTPSFDAESGQKPLANARTSDETETPQSEHVITSVIGDADDPLGFVELSGGPDFGAEALATTRRAVLLAAGGATVLAIVVGLLVGHGLTAPLRSLTATAEHMSDDLSTRAHIRGKDEIGQLARQLNDMAERLEASFAALTADRDALRRFIADASHELRTPITALKNFVELLRDLAADDEAARDEFLAESAAQVERLEWITSNLLNLSRLDAGLVTMELDTHDAGDLIKAAGGVLKTLAEENEITLSISLPASPVSLRCDRARVELALSNLLSNALKFTPHGGQVEIGAEAKAESVQMWVQDDGPGIDPEDQPHIFERFYRGRGNRAEGSGLGLAIVQSVVNAHHGHVWVESEPGLGSRFVLELPLNDTLKKTAPTSHNLTFLHTW